jgi:cell division septal protein FtsQ
MFSFRKKQSDAAPRRRQQAGDARRERASEAAEIDQNHTFRRNRTLTGSLSSRVSSATETTGDLKSSRTHAHHLTLQRRKIAGVLMVVLVIAGMIAGLLFNLTATPVVTSSDHALTLEASRYEKAINDYLAVRPIERLRFSLNEERLSDYLRQAVPEVADVEQDGFAYPGATDFTLTMRRPIASWIIGGKQNFVDGEGISFEKNYYETPTVSVIDQSGVQQEAGTAVASSRFLAFVGRVVAEAKTAGLTVEQAIIPVGTTRQLEVKVQGRAYPIKLSLDRGPAVQVEDMEHAIAYFDTHQQTPQYVDVRVSGKAFYR